MKSVLKHMREEKNLVQVTFARRAGTSQGYVSDVENGRRAMTPAFATKAAAVLGQDPVVLLCAHEFEKIARKDEEGDPDAPVEALDLAKRLLALLQEEEDEGGLDEEQQLQVHEIVSQLLAIVERKKPVATPRAGKPLPGSLDPASVGKASADVMGKLRALGAGRGMEVLDEDKVYAELEESALPVGTLAQLLDGASSFLADSRLSPAQRTAAENIYNAVLRRLNDLGVDGARSSFQYLAGEDPRVGGGFLPSRSDAAAVKARASEERRERLDHEESMHELGLDMYGRPLSASKEAHEKALKSASFLSQTERETGYDYRGLPLDERALARRKFIETGRRD